MELEELFDGISGAKLDPKLVHEARAEEMSFINQLGVYRYSTDDEARAVTGKMPIGTRWVDTDKGDRYRSRLCAMEFRRKSVATVFAGTPPLESLRVLAGCLARPKPHPGISVVFATANAEWPVQ